MPEGPEPHIFHPYPYPPRTAFIQACAAAPGVTMTTKKKKITGSQEPRTAASDGGWERARSGSPTKQEKYRAPGREEEAPRALPGAGLQTYSLATQQAANILHSLPHTSHQQPQTQWAQFSEMFTAVNTESGTCLAPEQ